MRARFLLLVGSLFWLMDVSLLAQESMWRFAPETDGARINDIDISLSNPDSVYAFAEIYDPKLFMSSDAGETWMDIARPQLLLGTSGDIKVDAFDSRVVYESLGMPSPGQWAFGIVDMTTDAGQTWNMVTSELPVIFDGFFAEADPVTRQIVYLGVGNGRITYTTDRGTTWDSLPQFPTTHGPSLFAIAHSNPGVFYATAAFPAEIYKSQDSGNTWSLASYPSSTPQGLVVDPRSDSIVYHTVYHGVYKSTDGASSWMLMNEGLSDTIGNIHGIALNPRDPDEIFIALGPPILVFRSANGGASWSRFDQGLPTSGKGAGSISIDTGNNKIFLGTNSGIYVTDLVTFVEPQPKNELPTRFVLSQNFPNPFNPLTTIRYAIAKRSDVNLEIYDLLGKKVKILVSEIKEPGHYEVNFNAEELTSGIYFYRLTAGSTVLTRKAVIIK